MRDNIRAFGEAREGPAKADTPLEKFSKRVLWECGKHSAACGTNSSFKIRNKYVKNALAKGFYSEALNPPLIKVLACRCIYADAFKIYERSYESGS